MKVLMCEPKHYSISYEINPWMKMDNQVNGSLAYSQWKNLHDTIQNIADEVHLVEPKTNLPDMVFTANAALIHKNLAYISNFRFNERKDESQHFNEWFLKQGFQTIFYDKKDDCFFEGAGDALFMGDLLFYGHGFRSDKVFHENLNTLNPENVILCNLVDPYFYHLDTCFCPINDSFAIWYPPAFSPESQKAITAKIELFAVPENEAKHFACNAVVLGKHVIIPADCPVTKKHLTDKGFTVHECDVSEFIKAGGACKCLTLLLD
ncbi:MAG: arginine deiminase-related protein [Legionellales bacterium]|jgi:N-dimethylarginine dimethylaminohydrolase